MIRHLLILAVLGCVMILGSSTATASNWVFRQARFTHDPVTGQRVTQYAEPAPAYVLVDPTYQRSGLIWQNIQFRSRRGGTDRIIIRNQWGTPWFY